MVRGLGFIAISVGAALFLSACAESDEMAQEAAITATLRDAAVTAQQEYDYKAAASHYLTLFTREPNDLEALLGAVRNLRYAGKAKQAIKTARQGLETHGDKPALILELGKAQLAASLISDARETLVKARELAPANWQAHSAMGVLQDRLGMFDEARIEYRRALELSPDNPVVLNNLALSYAQTGNLLEGIAILQEIANGEYSTLQVRQNLALLSALKGDFDRAETLAREDLSPEVAMENLARFRRLRE